MSDSVQPRRQQPIWLHHPWDSPGKITGVGCHVLLQRMKVKTESHSDVSDSSWPHVLQPTRLLCPWGFPGKSTGVGCHCLISLVTLDIWQFSSIIVSHAFLFEECSSCHWIHWKREFQKNIYFCFIGYAKAFDCVNHKKLWEILKEMGIPDHLNCLLRNLYAGQDATVRTGHGTMDWFLIRKRVCQGCILSLCLFNL